MDGSKRSSHSNAYFYGFWRWKRIVIFDTLLHLPHDEILAVLGKQDMYYLAATSRLLYSLEVRVALLLAKAWSETLQGAAYSRFLALYGHFCSVRLFCYIPSVAPPGHELGHWQKNHFTQRLAIVFMNLFFTLYLYGKVMNNDHLYRCFGYGEDARSPVIGLMLLGNILAPVCTPQEKPVQEQLQMQFLCVLIPYGCLFQE